MNNTTSLQRVTTGVPTSQRFAGVLASVALYMVLISWMVFVTFPLVWVIYTSFKTNRELYASVWALPQGLAWDNHLRAWREGKLGHAILNSLTYAGVSVLVSDLFGAMTAYVLSRFQFRGNRFLFYFFMAGVYVPVSLTVIPTFFLLRSLHLVDTRLGLTLVYTTWHMPFAVFVLYGFFKTLPGELLDAAAIDGCSEFGIFWRVALPLSSSGLVAVSAFNFLWVWNELLYALVCLQDTDLYSMPLAISILKSGTYLSGDWVMVFAAATIGVIPVALAYIFFQRQIIEGATMGALKG